MRYETLPIEMIELDYENPRIKQYLAIYKELNSETLSLALSGGGGNDGSEKYRALRDSIKQNGGIFTPIIVNHVTSEDTYTVIEGNTRLKFYTEFKDQGVEGEWSEIPCIVYDDMDEDQMHAIRLQAHMVGARDWDAYSKAKYLDYLYNEEHKPMQFLKDFCGGQESYIRNLIDAYNDMKKEYEPYCEEKGISFDPQHFSYYVELQKKGTKDVLATYGYDVIDFTKWLVDEKLVRAEKVRRLAAVMKDNVARNIFLKSNIEDAEKSLDASESEKRKIAKTNMYDLIQEVTKKLRNIKLKEIEFLVNEPSYEEKKDQIIDLKYEVDYVVEKIGED